MVDDFGAYSGKLIPSDSRGWREFQDNAASRWARDTMFSVEDTLFFRIPYSEQQRLQRNNTALEEAWKNYLILLAIYEESS